MIDDADKKQHFHFIFSKTEQLRTIESVRAIESFHYRVQSTTGKFVRHDIVQPIMVAEEGYDSTHIVSNLPVRAYQYYVTAAETANNAL